LARRLSARVEAAIGQHAFHRGRTPEATVRFDEESTSAALPCAYRSGDSGCPSTDDNHVVPIIFNTVCALHGGSVAPVEQVCQPRRKGPIRSGRIRRPALPEYRPRGRNTRRGPTE
jgi:hypothetical protein